MKILVITTSAWRNDDNAGNTMTNFFEEDLKDSFYNLYFRSDLPNNSLCSSAFHIWDSEIIKNFFGLRRIGREEKECLNVENISTDFDIKAYNKYRGKNKKLLWILRDVCWLININYKSLFNYIDKVKPDVIFYCASCYNYIYRILFKIIKKYKIKLYTFYGDDNYMKKESYSILNAIYNKSLKNKIKKCIQVSKINYCSSPLHVEAYKKEFSQNFQVLFKTKHFSDGIFNYKTQTNKDNLVFLYTGNLFYGRFETLLELGYAIEKFNKKNNSNHLLIIYSGNNLSIEEKRKLNMPSIDFRGYIDSRKIAEIQSEADVLIHVESFFDLTAKYSFSTKIIDYLYAQKCILALGNKSLSSIKFLVDNDAAFVIDNLKYIDEQIDVLIKNQFMMRKFALNAWNVGCNYADKNNNNLKFIEEIGK